MNFTELKRKIPAELMNIAQQLGIERVSNMRKQDMIFAILKAHAKKVKIFMAMAF